MKFKFHNTDRYASCGAVAIGTVLGENSFDIERKIIKYRQKHPPNLNDYIVLSNWREDRSITFFEEAIHFVRPFIGKNKVETPTKRMRLLDLVCTVLNPNYIYMVMTKDHIQIVHDYKVWDTVSRRNDINAHIWNKRPVIKYIRLNKTGVKTK